jgi:hypothetical protein
MPTIKLTDQFGLNLDAQLGDTSALLKYIRQLPSMRFEDVDLNKLAGLTLDQPALTSLSTGISFQDPVVLGEGAPALTVAAGVSGSLQIVRKAEDLPGHGDPIDLPDANCYVAFAIDATLRPMFPARPAFLNSAPPPRARCKWSATRAFPATLA